MTSMSTKAQITLKLYKYNPKQPYKAIQKCSFMFNTISLVVNHFFHLLFIDKPQVASFVSIHKFGSVPVKTQTVLCVCVDRIDEGIVS